jgi:predicted dinucleotide-binding enzyme
LGSGPGPGGRTARRTFNLNAELKDRDMKIGVIGAGFIARGVIAVAMRSGHDVMVSNSRGPETVFSLTGSTGCKAGTPAEAAAFGDLVVVAIPLKAYQTVPVAELEGKIVLDANNYYPDRDGHIAELDTGAVTSSELLARHLSQSRIVKAFNAIASADIAKDGRGKACHLLHARRRSTSFKMFD